MTEAKQSTWADWAAARLEHGGLAHPRLVIALERLAAAEPGDDLFDVIAGAVVDGVDARRALIGRRVAAGDEVVVVGTAGGSAWPRGQRVRLDTMPWRACFEAPGEIVVIERDLASLQPGSVTQGKDVVESFLGVAFADKQGRWTGVLAVFGERPRADTAADRALLHTAARRLAQEFERGDREARLREREQHLELAMEVSDVTVTVWDVGADAIEVGGNWLQRFDIGRADDGRLRMADWLAAIHPDDLPATSSMADVLRSSDAPTSLIDYRMRARDGGWRWVHGRARVIERGEGGTPRVVVSVQSDIHDFAAKEAELRASETQLRLALDAGGLSIADWYPETDVVRLSAWWSRELGYADDEIGPRRADYAAITHPDDAPAVERYLRDHLTGVAVVAPIEFRLRRRDGSWCWVRLQAQVTARDATGRATRMTGVFANVDDARKAAAALAERTAYLELVVRGSSDGLWSWDGDAGNELYLSPRFHELLGYAVGELPTRPGRFAVEIYHPEDLGRIRRLVAQMRAHPEDGDILSCDVRLRCADGEFRWFHNRAAMSRRADGSLQRFAGSISEVHERRLREQEAIEARQRLHDAIEAIDSGLMISDRDDRLVLSNRRYREMYEFSAELVRPGTHISALARDLMRRHPEYRKGKPMEEAVAERIDMHRARRGRWELELGDRWYQIGDYETGEGGVVSLRTDITHLKRTEQALRESEARLRTVFDNSPLGIFLAGTDGAIVFCNPVFATITGADPNEWRKHAWLSHVHEDERAWIGARWYEYVAAATGSFDIEYRTADTPARSVRLRAAPIVEQGQALGFAGTLEDVSAQRQAELEQHRLQLQLQQAQKMDAIGHLTGGIAHDFNNILASILGYAALAGERSSTQDDAKLVTYLDAIRQSGERARELVAKMLAFSRSEPRDIVTPTSVQPLVGEAVKLLKAIIPANIHIVTVSEPGLPPVLVDGVDLHQAIINLAVNARDAIAGHGQITIAVRAPRQVQGLCASCRESFAERYVEIAVSDTGAGIAPENLPRLFEPFFSTKDVGKGTGMGLAVTHGVVHRVGGHILVETAPGVGTTVRLLLRAAPATTRATATSTTATATPAPRVARILVVDDEPLVMGLISEVLEVQGYAVAGYTDSRQALAWARGPDARFDLLITDQTMPGLTGVELARELLAMHPMLPVILCTGFSESVDARVAAAMGIRHFFSKPIPLERLLAAVDTLLNDGPAPAIIA